MNIDFPFDAGDYVKISRQSDTPVTIPDGTTQDYQTDDCIGRIIGCTVYLNDNEREVLAIVDGHNGSWGGTFPINGVVKLSRAEIDAINSK